MLIIKEKQRSKVFILRRRFCLGLFKSMRRRELFRYSAFQENVYKESKRVDKEMKEVQSSGLSFASCNCFKFDALLD